MPAQPREQVAERDEGEPPDPLAGIWPPTRTDPADRSDSIDAAMDVITESPPDPIDWPLSARDR